MPLPYKVRIINHHTQYDAESILEAYLAVVDYGLSQELICLDQSPNPDEPPPDLHVHLWPLRRGSEKFAMVFRAKRAPWWYSDDFSGPTANEDTEPHARTVHIMVPPPDKYDESGLQHVACSLENVASTECMSDIVSRIMREDGCVFTGPKRAFGGPPSTPRKVARSELTTYTLLAGAIKESVPVRVHPLTPELRRKQAVITKKMNARKAIIRFKSSLRRRGYEGEWAARNLLRILRKADEVENKAKLAGIQHEVPGDLDKLRRELARAAKAMEKAHKFFKGYKHDNSVYED